ncbi:hypothetical protein [Ruegeria sp. Ofav3-42]|uniref:hypothetical protein n=1 Tax=Ruegeria sp. Ofav3-42 TaxID=2917759 RepID=UPI001EF59A2A|nr:hypothetical protein [Ruegeria sp. Ofav3-42]MCG7518854.1 hypothetical protein [Ruegeria sp. Ofav3-42]
MSASRDPQSSLVNVRIELAFQGRVPMKLFFDLKGFDVSVYVIERLRIRRQKTTPKGRLVRVEIEVELIESASPLGSLRDAAAGVVRAAVNPALRRLR